MRTAIRAASESKAQLRREVAEKKAERRKIWEAYLPLAAQLRDVTSFIAEAEAVIGVERDGDPTIAEQAERMLRSEGQPMKLVQLLDALMVACIPVSGANRDQQRVNLYIAMRRADAKIYHDRKAKAWGLVEWQRGKQRASA